MNARDIDSLSAAIGRHLRANRSAVMQEKGVHNAIAAAFAEIGMKVEREYRLTPESRLDFFLSDCGTAVEVKKGNAGLPVVSQIGRYFESEKVTGCILVAMRIDPAVPKTFRGKPIAHLPLWKFLL
jgi:hypothetical protein